MKQAIGVWLCLCVTCCCAAGLADEPRQAQLEPGPLAPVLQAMLDQHLIAGAVTLVENEDKVLDTEAVGFSSLRRKTPMQQDDLFWIASMSKSITATAFMMLVDEGKVNIDDPVEKYLPEFKGQMVADENDKDHPHPPKHPITIKEILSHTSGLIRASDPKAVRAYVLKDNVAGYASMPLIREPGTKYEYNNCGISTAGRIIEVLSGLSYSDFVQQRLFDPLEMKDTTFWPNAEQARRLAKSAHLAEDKSGLDEVELDKALTPAGIVKFGGGVPVPREILEDFGGGILPTYAHHFAEPAGGIFSTAHDLGNFCQMLLAGGTWHGKKFLSEKAIHQMGSNQTGDIAVSPDEAYGLGWMIKLKANEGPSPGSFGHRGARRTVMWIDPTNHLAMILLIEHFNMPADVQRQVYGGFFTAAVKRYGSAAHGHPN